MSVAHFLHFLAEFERRRQEVIDFGRTGPTIYLLVANPVFGRSESINPIAAFDTRGAALDYVLGSMLPARATSEDGYHRTFRPDSLLWDYNPAFTPDQMVKDLNTPLFDWPPELAVNPPQPTGPCPPLARPTPQPRYGHDYATLPRELDPHPPDLSREVPKLPT